MKRAQAINLYNSINDTRIGQIENETVSKYIDLRIALKKVQSDFEAFREETLEQTKPKGWKEGDDTSKWNEAFKPIIEKWLNEEISLDAKIFSTDEVISFVKENDLNGQVMDVIVELMRK